MKVANIVSQNKINVSDDINVVKSLDEVIQGLPTLIIGWDYIKKNYPDYDIANRKFSDILYWTFKKTEKRDLFEEDLYNFKKIAYSKLLNNVKYYFVDPIALSIKEIKKLIKKLTTSVDVVTYQHHKMLYLYIDNIIFGIDLSLLEYMNVSVDKTITKIKRISKYFLTNDTIFIEYEKRMDNIDNQVKFIPLLYSIEHE